MNGRVENRKTPIARQSARNIAPPDDADRSLAASRVRPSQPASGPDHRCEDARKVADLLNDQLDFVAAEGVMFQSDG